MKSDYLSRSKLLAAWLVAALLCVALVGGFAYRAGVDELSRRLAEAETRLAEKLAQHDAHLTAIAAVVRLDEEPSHSVQGLAEALITFYPRITAIETLRASGDQAVVTSFGAPSGAQSRPTRPAADLPDLATPGSTAIRGKPGEGRYDLYKLVEPGIFLRMEIDAGGVIAEDLLPPDYGYQLWLDGHLLLDRAGQGGGILSATQSLAINSPSQPLRLEVSRHFSLLELLPPLVLLPLLAALGVAIWLIAQYRGAVLARREQERRASLLEQEARLAHAGRVNALGEMASGIAHELAQPVAALLSQSQAARRAATMNLPDVLDQALEANVREAKRAGDILGRIRAYIAGDAPRMERMPLDQALADALRLAEPDLTRRGIRLDSHVEAGAGTVRIDVIAFQQVIHNLLRNAAEALAGHPHPVITVRGACVDGKAEITVADNGPGIPADELPRVFEPFFTTRVDGMGLGLPLCARLIENMDGSIHVTNQGGAVFTILLPCEASQ